MAHYSVLLANVSRSGLKNVSEYIRQVSHNPNIVPRLNETEMVIARKLSGMSNNSTNSYVCVISMDSPP